VVTGGVRRFDIHPPPGARIGILGGSFNPAHAGHRHISRVALKHLRLDAVWWLVSPQNPLKPVAGMAPFAERLASCRRAAGGERRIHPTDLEVRLGSRYTADTLARLVRSFPGHHFVWLMGADNLAQIHRWRGWAGIFATMPIAVLARPSYAAGALRSRAALRFSRWRQRPEAAGGLARVRPPAWVFLPCRLHPASSTALRASATRDYEGDGMRIGASWRER
jgi:nicotinate-nucleotide adenylyltransferase